MEKVFVFSALICFACTGAAARQLVQMPDTRERFAALNLEPVGSSPEEFAQFLKQDLRKYAEIARKAKIELQ